MPQKREALRLGGAFAVATYLFGYASIVGTIQHNLAPIVIDRGSVFMFRTPGLACWRWVFERRRGAMLDNSDLDVIDTAGNRVDAVALILDRETKRLRYFRSNLTSPAMPGQMQSRDICIDLDRAVVAPGTPLIARLTMTYVAEGGTARVPYEMSPVRIPPLPPMIEGKAEPTDKPWMKAAERL